MATWTDKELVAWTRALKAGDVVAAPAEGVYGYCADPLNPQALQEIMRVKQRSPKKGLICLVPDVASLGWICGVLNSDELNAVGQYWPCGKEDPITLVLPAQPHTPELLTGGRETLAVRCPATDYMQEYLQAWKQMSGHGVLVSTSYNVSGELPVVKGSDVGGVALRLKEALPGRVSRVFVPREGVWLR